MRWKDQFNQGGAISLQPQYHKIDPELRALQEANARLKKIIEVIDRFEFESIYHAQMVIDCYYEWYNEKRRHGSLNHQNPETAWKKYNPVPFENEKLLNYL